MSLCGGSWQASVISTQSQVWVVPADLYRVVAEKTCTILIVDDEKSIRRTVGVLLAKSGFTVLEAADPSEARRIWNEQSKNIDLLVVDIVLQRVSGADIVRDFLQNGSNVPIIFATGIGIDQAVKLTKDIPRSAILQKPFTPGELMHAIKNSQENVET